MDAGRGAGRHGRPADRSIVQDDVDLDGRIAARVEDLASVDVFDRGRHAPAFAFSFGFDEALALAFGLAGAPGLSSSTETPGSSRPSRNSSDAPPPVEMWVILSARPCWVTAATESPPPTTTVAPFVARSATKRAIAFVPCANEGISNTPSGPFQKTVRASESASCISSSDLAPTSTMCHE